MKIKLFLTFGLMFFLAIPSIGKATDITLLCVGEEQGMLGNWKKISSLITIKNGRFECKDTKQRKYGCILTSGPVKMADDYIYLLDSGKNSIDRTSGQFVYSDTLKAYTKSVDITCAPKAKMF